MSSLSRAATSFSLAAMGAALACATPAAALDAGQCLPIDQINQAMQAEGQRTVIISNRVALRGRETATGADIYTREWVNTVTSNADGSVGYQLEGDRPRTEASAQICVRAKLTNVRLFDARLPTVANDAMLGGRFDNWITAQASDGTRPMMVADTVFGSGPTLRYGRPLVVIGNLNDRFGAIATQGDNTGPEMLAQLRSVEYTSVGLERIGGRQVAALTPGLGGR